MRQKSVPEKDPATQVMKNIRRATRRHFSAEDKIRIVLEPDEPPRRISAEESYRTPSTVTPTPHYRSKLGNPSVGYPRELLV
jgi:hypothetical protein